MAKNLIPEIMKMLGVEYGEEFKIRRPDYEVCENGIYAFFENEGLVKKNKQGEFDDLPVYLQPIEDYYDIVGLDAGDGRNSKLYAYILKLMLNQELLD